MALKTCAGGSPYVFPSRYDGDQPISKATLNRVTGAVIEEALADGVPLAPFTPHDFRRTGSTALHEAGFQLDWIEKCLAHEQRGVRAVYNKAEYAEQRRVKMGPLSSTTKQIGVQAQEQGFNVIRFYSERSNSGMNNAVLDNFNQISRPVSVAAVKP